MLDSSAYRKKNYEVVELSSIHTYIYVKSLKTPEWCLSLLLCVHPIIYEAQQMNSSIGWINAFSKSPVGQRQKGEREWVKENERNKAREQKIHWVCFFVAEELSSVALKGGIILSSKQTFGYSWLAEQLRGLKEDTARMGLNIKVNLRRAGLGYELAIAETQRSQRGVMGSRGDQLSGGWIALWMIPRWGSPKSIQEDDMLWCVHLSSNMRHVHTYTRRNIKYNDTFIFIVSLCLLSCWLGKFRLMDDQVWGWCPFSICL